MDAHVILFDVNETLLDMSPLKKKVNDVLDSKRGFRVWFGMLLQYSLVDNCTNNYHDFTKIVDAALDMAAKAFGNSIDEEDKKSVLSLVTQLPAHNDVKDGLQQLKDAGYRLATLTNSPPQTLKQQMQHAELTNYFVKTLSIDAVKKYKPAKDAYLYAADQLGTSPGEIIMVAAHGWDIAGAIQAGLQAAFIEREGQSLYPLAPAPNFIGKDLKELAGKIIDGKKLL